MEKEKKESRCRPVWKLAARVGATCTPCWWFVDVRLRSQISHPDKAPQRQLLVHAECHLAYATLQKVKQITLLDIHTGAVRLIKKADLFCFFFPAEIMFFSHNNSAESVFLSQIQPSERRRTNHQSLKS